MDTKVIRAENLVDMYTDLEAALYREAEIHGDNADMELTKAVAHWALELRDAGLLGDHHWRITTKLLDRVGFPID